MLRKSHLSRFLYFALAIPYLTCQGQDSTFSFQAALQAAVVNHDTPLWLQANQYGAIPLEGSFLSGQWTLFKDYKKTSPLKDRIPFFNWAFKAKLVSNRSNQKTDFFFTDLFVALKAGAVELSVGQREDFMGLCDSTLTSGSVAMSGNARPYPKIQLATPEYVNLHFLDDFVGFKASYSDGLLGPATVQFGLVNYIPAAYLHQKSLYMRLGRPWQKLNFYGGFNHQAMWGGENKIFSGGLDFGTAYEYVVIGKPWAASRVGNHFGTIDLGIELKLKKWEYFLYRQNIYEDGSLIQFMNISDGLNGFRIKRRHYNPNHKGFQIKTLVIELLNTQSQSGSIFDYDAGIFGSDNYFNHYIYQQGWSYRHRTLGTPLIVPQSFMSDAITRDPRVFTTNNRLSALHLGLDSRWNRTNLKLLATYSTNLGSYSAPLSPNIKQWSLLLSVSRLLPGLFNSYIGLAASADFGQLYRENSAFSLSWVKKVTFN